MRQSDGQVSAQVKQNQSDHEINKLLARSEGELELFSRLDEVIPGPFLVEFRYCVALKFLAAGECRLRSSASSS